MVSVQCEDQAARQHEDGVVEALVVTGQSGNILVDEGVGIQQPPVPRLAGIQVADGEGGVVDGGNYGHARLLVSWPRRNRSRAVRVSRTPRSWLHVGRARFGKMTQSAEAELPT
jgi:hypothetical protein